MLSAAKHLSAHRNRPFTALRVTIGGSIPDLHDAVGTNNACERAIGWWIKERYRSMRGDIRAQECGARQSLPGLVWQLPHE